MGRSCRVEVVENRGGGGSRWWRIEVVEDRGVEERKCVEGQG